MAQTVDYIDWSVIQAEINDASLLMYHLKQLPSGSYDHNATNSLRRSLQAAIDTLVKPISLDDTENTALDLRRLQELTLQGASLLNQTALENP